MECASGKNEILGRICFWRLSRQGMDPCLFLLGRAGGAAASGLVKNKSIAVEVPLEDLQRHSSVRKGRKQVNCRLDAAGGSPAALKRQKRPKASQLPFRCRWKISSGTQASLQRQKSAWTSQEAYRSPSGNQKPAKRWAEFCHETRNLL